MTRQNRVLPTGDIVALPVRGAWMGNRGILHDEEGRLGRARWRHLHWIICRLAFKGRRRPIMAPRRYTELFFFDEAVALAAGHRPCAECRRGAFNAFRAAWAEAHGCTPQSAIAMDDALHAARIDRTSRRQLTHVAPSGVLPNGAFVRGADGAPSLLWNGALHRYLGDRYGPPERPDPAARLDVLTPAPTLGALLAGYPVSVNLPG